MNIVFFSHPDFFGSMSMPRFTNMLIKGLQDRGHQLKLWKPTPFFFHLPFPKRFKKWLGYLDQYIVFPLIVLYRLRKTKNTQLYVFIDHALGPWVPLVKDKPHVIHCHDFLAQMSAQNQIEENKTSRSGRFYQYFIRKGYIQGENFISVSKKTRHDLHNFLKRSPKYSEVIYNGLNHPFYPQDKQDSRLYLSEKVNLNLNDGYILHVGGNQWYKNRLGVIKVFNSWRSLSAKKLPLLMVGQPPNNLLLEEYERSGFKDDIFFITDLDNDEVNKSYSGASIFFFPSLAEGFGWPIIEAMASGCIVLTTNEPPMTEVADDLGFYIRRMPSQEDQKQNWVVEASRSIDDILCLAKSKKEEIINNGLIHAENFNNQKTIADIEKMYYKIINSID